MPVQSPYKDVQGSFQSPGCLSPTPVLLGTWLSPGWEHSSGPHMDRFYHCIPRPAPALLIVWIREMGHEGSCEVKRTSKSDTSDPRGNPSSGWLYAVPKTVQNSGTWLEWLFLQDSPASSLENTEVLTLLLWRWVSLTPPKLQFDPKLAAARAHPWPPP